MTNYFFDNIIKDKAAGHEAPVPADAWNNIKKQKKKKRGIYWWMFAVLLIGSGLFGWYQMQYPTIIAKQTSNKKNITAGEKGKVVSRSNNVNVIIQTDQQEGDSMVDNVPAEPQRNNIKRAGERGLPAPAGVSITAIRPVKPSKNKKPGHLNIKDKTKKENMPGEAVDDNTVIAVRPVKKTGIKNKEVLAGNKNKNSVKWKTKVKIAVFATGDAEEGELTAITVVTADEKIITIDITSNSKDSVNTITDPIVKKQSPAVDIAIKQVTKAVKRNKRTIFADVSIMPFVPVQNSAPLLNIKRLTVDNLSRSEFTTDEISTTVAPALSYGFALRKKIATKWYAGAGLQFAQIKENITLSGKETNTSYSVIKRLDNTGLLLVNDTIATVTRGKRIINATNSYDLISIPVFVQYNLAERKAWSLSLNGGLNFTVKSIYKNSIEGTLVPAYITATGANKKENAITTDIFSAMRLARTAGKNLKVYAEPNLQFNLQQYKMPAIVNYKSIHRVGITVGATYQINY